MEDPTRAIIAVIGSVLILCWPILVMLVRAIIEGRRWRNWLMARAWMGSWFSGSGLWITAAWITVIIVIRFVTDAALGSNPNAEVIGWVLVVLAMILVSPFAWRAPREPSA